MPAEYVRPYMKNDFIDAEAIAEAVLRPTMRFVPLKTAEQLDLQALHRACNQTLNPYCAFQVSAFITSLGKRPYQ
jgi:transposase